MKLKIIKKNSTFTTTTIVEINNVQYVILTKGQLDPVTNKKSKAITFDFKRVDGKKLTEPEEQIGDKIFDQIIKNDSTPK